MTKSVWPQHGTSQLQQSIDRQFHASIATKLTETVSGHQCRRLLKATTDKTGSKTTKTRPAEQSVFCPVGQKPLQLKTAQKLMAKYGSGSFDGVPSSRAMGWQAQRSRPNYRRVGSKQNYWHWTICFWQGASQDATCFIARHPIDKGLPRGRPTSTGGAGVLRNRTSQHFTPYQIPAISIGEIHSCSFTAYLDTSPVLT